MNTGEQDVPWVRTVLAARSFAFRWQGGNVSEDAKVKVTDACEGDSVRHATCQTRATSEVRTHGYTAHRAQISNRTRKLPARAEATEPILTAIDSQLMKVRSFAK